MKFTEGFWLRKESVQASYATQAYTVEEIPGGMRIVAPEHPIHSRADALDLTALVLEFVSAGHNDIAVTATHFQGYEPDEPRYELNLEPEPTELTVTEDEAVLKAGDITVRVHRDPFSYQFEADGKVLTTSGFRNLGYMRVNKRPMSYRPGKHYLTQEYEPYMLSELSLKPGETVYGFGERFTPFVKNGQTVTMWNEDGGTASEVSYKNVPLYVSSEHYAVFADHTGPASFEVGTEKVEFVGLSVPGEQIRYHLIYGETPEEIMAVYTNLTGKPALPPAWSFGLWLSTSFKPEYDEETTGKLIAGMQDRNIPTRVFHFDCYWMKALHWCDFTWDDEVFSDVEGMLQRYHDKGLKVCCWINPYIGQNNDMFREGMENGYFLMRWDGKGIKQVDNWQPGLAVLDVTNPDACEWYAGKIRDLLRKGVDAIKTDFGERIPIDVEYYDGSDPMAMHNYYSYLYNKLVFETLEEEKGKGNAVLFARSGTAGSQKFPVHWGGDCSATYASMAETLRAGLSFAMSGFAFWSHDISGFESTATPDLYKRWVQFGLFSTHSRLHGADTYRVPWLFDEESVDVVRYFAELKNTLMPYLYSTAVKAHNHGTPMMRPMIFSFPEDPACKYLDMQYMLGDSLLVAPVFNEEGRTSFYLPEGLWKNLLDGEVLSGGRWYERTYDYFHMAVFVKGDTILPVGGNKAVPDYDYLEDLTLHYYLPTEDRTCRIEIPDLSGTTLLEVEASCRNGKVHLQMKGDRKPEKLRYVVHLEDGSEENGELR
ncbi:MAG: alpha-xylosidase [Lachnospiraceae bacterium]|nr:alpha-xylosidase [Lachnospiraceae bacterium]